MKFLNIKVGGYLVDKLEVILLPCLEQLLKARPHLLPLNDICYFVMKIESKKYTHIKSCTVPFNLKKVTLSKISKLWYMYFKRLRTISNTKSKE